MLEQTRHQHGKVIWSQVLGAAQDRLLRPVLPQGALGLTLDTSPTVLVHSWKASRSLMQAVLLMLALRTLEPSAKGKAETPRHEHLQRHYHLICP